MLLCCVGCVKDTGVLVPWRLSGAIREDIFSPYNRWNGIVLTQSYSNDNGNLRGHFLVNMNKSTQVGRDGNEICVDEKDLVSVCV